MIACRQWERPEKFRRSTVWRSCRFGAGLAGFGCTSPLICEREKGRPGLACPGSLRGGPSQQAPGSARRIASATARISSENGCGRRVAWLIDTQTASEVAASLPSSVTITCPSPSEVRPR